MPRLIWQWMGKREFAFSSDVCGLHDRRVLVIGIAWRWFALGIIAGSRTTTEKG